MEKTREQVKIEQLVLYNLVQLNDLFPQYSISQHLWHLLRSKGDEQPYYWDNNKLLSKVEQYLDELHTELANSKFEDNDSISE